MAVAEMIEDPGALRPWIPRWDELAVRAGRPFCAPAWMLAWWSNAAPHGASLRVVVVRDRDELVAVAPFFVVGTTGRAARYRALGARASMRVEPVAAPGREDEAAPLIASALAGADPAPGLIAFEGTPEEPGWPARLARAWPSGGEAALYRDVARPAPFLVLAGRSYEEWLGSQSRNFRQQMGRARRRLEAKGARFVMAGTPAEAEAGLGAFARLHHGRWTERGGSAVLTTRVESMLAAASRGLVGSGRFRLWSIQIGERVISSHLFLAAGGEVAYWLGGFDDDYAAERPALLTLLAAVEHAWSAGDRRVDFGGGGQPYKYRFAESDEPLEWTYLIPPGPRSLAARFELLPRRMYRRLQGLVPQSTLDRVKRMLPSRR